MKVLVKRRIGEELQLCDYPMPEPKEGEVRIKTCYAGICGTDIHIRHDEFPTVCPRVIGHEFSGVIDKIGPGVTGFSLGDRVVSNTAAFTCGTCKYCLSKRPMLCSKKRGLGSGVDGCFSEYFVILADCVYHLPEHLSMAEAALIEPYACTVRALLERTTIRPGDKVFVVGLGTIGQMAVQIAKMCGATVIASSRSEAHLQIAQKLGADAIIRTNRENISERAFVLTDGEMFDKAIECSGIEKSLENCIECLGNGGELIQIGLFGRNVSVPMDRLLLKECRISTTYAAEPTSWQRALELIEEHKIRLDDLVSGVFPIQEWKLAFEEAESKRGFRFLFKFDS